MNLTYSILFGVVYTVGYVFLALLATGGGHGNFISLMFIVTWVFNFAALFLLARLETSIVRIFFVVMMSLYYLINLLILFSASKDEKALTQPLALLNPAIWYISGQIFIWAVFFRQIRDK